MLTESYNHSLPYEGLHIWPWFALPHQNNTCPCKQGAKSGNQCLQPGIKAILHGGNGLLHVLLGVMSCSGPNKSIKLPESLCD